MKWKDFKKLKGKDFWQCLNAKHYVLFLILLFPSGMVLDYLQSYGYPPLYCFLYGATILPIFIFLMIMFMTPPQKHPRKGKGGHRK